MAVAKPPALLNGPATTEQYSRDFRLLGFLMSGGKTFEEDLLAGGFGLSREDIARLREATEMFSLDAEQEPLHDEVDMSPFEVPAAEPYGIHEYYAPPSWHAQCEVPDPQNVDLDGYEAPGPQDVDFGEDFGPRHECQRCDIAMEAKFTKDGFTCSVEIHRNQAHEWHAIVSTSADESDRMAKNVGIDSREHVERINFAKPNAQSARSFAFRYMKDKLDAGYECTHVYSTNQGQQEGVNNLQQQPNSCLNRREEDYSGAKCNRAVSPESIETNTETPRINELKRKRESTPCAEVSFQMKGQTSIQEVAKYFHLPINEAANDIGMCPTVLKKICRRHGLQRWPHRKLKSIEKTLTKLKGGIQWELENIGRSQLMHDHHAKAILERIDQLEREKDEIYSLH